MKRLLSRILIGLVLLTSVAWGIDEISVLLRHEPYADVHIDRFLAIAEKFNKIDYERTDPITERCVYALFPHSGHNPCWYVTRHTLRFIKVG
jgi:hypothetical protein